MNGNGETKLLNSIKLLYDCGYPLVVTDAQAILEEYESQSQMDLRHLRCCDAIWDFAPELDLSEEEKRGAVVQRDGEVYILIGEGKCQIEQVAFEKGWKPRE